jgi:hypothetical protein
MILTFGYFNLLGNVITTPSPSFQLARINNHVNSYQQTKIKFAELIKKYTQPNEKVGIIHEWGHELAITAQVKNVFPFTAEGSLILKSQLDTVMKAFEKAGVRHVFFGERVPIIALRKWITQKYSYVQSEKPSLLPHLPNFNYYRIKGFPLKAD